MVPGAWSVSCADWRSFVFIVLIVDVPCLFRVQPIDARRLSHCTTCVLAHHHTCIRVTSACMPQHHPLPPHVGNSC